MLDALGAKTRFSEAEARDKNVYLVERRKKRSLEAFRKCPTLYGSGARYFQNDNYGYLMWVEFRPVKRTPEGEIPEKFEVVSRLDSRVDPDAPFTEYKDLHQIVLYPFFTIEDAIRSVRDHILPSEKGRETKQITAAKKRLMELSDFYSNRSFASITPAELTKEEANTLALLQEIGVPDLQKLVNPLKQKMFTWLVKASGGRDAKGRENYLVTINALRAALRRVVLRENAVRDPILGKFLLIEQATMFARDYYRSLFDEVAQELQTMSGIVIFKHEGVVGKEFDVNMTLAKLKTLIFLLHQPHVDPYHWRGIEASNQLMQVYEALAKDKMVNHSHVEAIAGVRQSLLDELERHRDLSPQAAKEFIG